MRDSKYIYYSIRNLAVIAIVLWGGAEILVFSKIDLLIHNYSIGSIPAHNFLDRIADFGLPHDGKDIMLVGPSTVREGFDEDLISQLTGQYCVNCGVTSKGSIYHTEMQLDIIANYKIKPDVLVLGLNSRMLSLRSNPIGTTRYIDYINNEQLKIHINREPTNSVDFTEVEKIKANLWPGYHFALRLDYLARFALMHINQFIGNWNRLKWQDFAKGQDGLFHHSKYLYKEQEFSEEAFREQWKGYQSLGLLNPNLYGTLDDIISLHRVIEKSIQLSENVVIIVMPENSRIRDTLGSWGNYAFNTVLSEYLPDKIRVIDLKSSIPDNLIRDLAHLVPEGRRQFSELVAGHIMGIIDN